MEPSNNRRGSPCRLLSTAAVASEYGIPKATLEADRALDRGIPFIRHCRTVLYARADIDAYIEANRHRPAVEVHA